MSWRCDQAEAVRSGGPGVPTTVREPDASHKDARGSGVVLAGATDMSARPTRRFRGTRWNPRGFWVARISVDGAARYLGSFDTEEEAAQAYDTAAVAHFGSHSRRNFPHAEAWS